MILQNIFAYVGLNLYADSLSQMLTRASVFLLMTLNTKHIATYTICKSYKSDRKMTLLFITCLLNLI